MQLKWKQLQLIDKCEAKKKKIQEQELVRLKGRTINLLLT